MQFIEQKTRNKGESSLQAANKAKGRFPELRKKKGIRT